MTEASPISKELFPPRVDMFWDYEHPYHHRIHNWKGKPPTNAEPVIIEYLSLTEHQALLVAARREARAELMEELKREGKF